jgi:hypothetical protein
MRAIVVIAALAACGNDPGPRLIAGGGIGDGDIDGTLHVFVIDNSTEEPITNAMVDVGGKTGTTDATGLISFADLSGAQTISVLATGYVSTVWADADGANVTVPVAAVTTRPDEATLTGTIGSWDMVTVPAGHAKAAIVLYSNDDKLGDAANNIPTPGNTNICGVSGATCDWSIHTRTGEISLVAAILDRQQTGQTVTQTIIGWAALPGITVVANVAQSGLLMNQIEVGNLQNATIDLGTPPAGLTEMQSIIGVEMGAGEVVQLPTFLDTPTPSQFLVPQPQVFWEAATYRLTAVASTTSGAMGAQSVVLRQGLAGPDLHAGEWLVPPTSVVASRTQATFDPVTDARAHSVTWADANGQNVLAITDFDPAKTEIDVPSLVALPATGALTAKVEGIGADFDAHDFSLDDDRRLLWGVATQPTAVP